MKIIAILFLSTLTFAATGQDKVTTLIFMRHAEKDMIGSDPYLTEKGKLQAECVANLLEFMEIDEVFSTPYNRTRQTAEPIASRHALAVREYDPNNSLFIDQLKRNNKGKTIVVVGHSNTIPIFLASLKGESEVKFMDDDEYDKLFIAVVTDYEPLKILNLKIPCRF